MPTCRCAASPVRTTRRGGRWRAATALTCALAAIGVTSSAVVAAPLPAGFAGVVADDLYVSPDSARAQALGQIQAMGLTVIRRAFYWDEIEPVAGQRNWGSTDRLVLDAARRGVRIMPIAFGEPAWASSRPAGNTTHGFYPPKRLSDFAAFTGAIAARYGSRGTLWAEHPEVPAAPVTDLQVWNEPNLGKIYWLPKTSAPGYAAMLKAAAPAIRQADPKMHVVTAGLPQSSIGTPLLVYIKDLYKAGAGPAMDVIAINAYATSSAAFMSNLNGVRKLADKSGGKSDALHVTEFGWSDAGPGGRFKVGASRQASLISSVVKQMLTSRKRLKLSGFIYFAWADSRPYEGKLVDWWGLHTGLFGLDGKPKPAAAALARVLAAGQPIPPKTSKKGRAR